jgi:hypothetical protein
MWLVNSTKSAIEEEPVNFEASPGWLCVPRKSGGSRIVKQGGPSSNFLLNINKYKDIYCVYVWTKYISNQIIFVYKTIPTSSDVILSY